MLALPPVRRQWLAAAEASEDATVRCLTVERGLARADIARRLKSRDLRGSAVDVRDGPPPDDEADQPAREDSERRPDSDPPEPYRGAGPEAADDGSEQKPDERRSRRTMAGDGTQHPDEDDRPDKGNNPGRHRRDGRLADHRRPEQRPGRYHDDGPVRPKTRKR